MKGVLHPKIFKLAQLRPRQELMEQQQQHQQQQHAGGNQDEWLEQNLFNRLVSVGAAAPHAGASLLISGATATCSDVLYEGGPTTTGVNAMSMSITQSSPQEVGHPRCAPPHDPDDAPDSCSSTSGVHGASAVLARAHESLVALPEHSRFLFSHGVDSLGPLLAAPPCCGSRRVSVSSVERSATGYRLVVLGE